MSDQDFRTADEHRAIDKDRTIDESVTGAGPGPVDDSDSQSAAEGLRNTPEEKRAYAESVERGAAQRGEGAPEV